MFKLCLCVVVLLCSTLIGNWFASRLKNRRNSLLILIEVITRMKNHFAFSGFDIFRVVSESFKGFQIFEAFADYNNSEDFHLWWKTGILSLSSESGLNQEDKRLLIRFSDSLGVTDVEGQISNCDFYIDVFTQRLKAADATEYKNARLYKTLGFSLGCILILVLM